MEHNSLEPDSPESPLTEARLASSLAAPERMPRPDWLIASAIGLVATVAIGLTWGGYGHSWDEAYYFEPAQLTREWLAQVVRLDADAFTKGTLDRHWGGDEVGASVAINELPALPKVAWALGLALCEEWLGPRNAIRAPVALAFGLLLVLVYRFAHAIGGRAAGVLAALLLATMPRVWAEAHLAVAETFAALTFTLTVYLFWRGLFSWRWAVVAGVVFGLALNTKIQAVLIPIALTPWALMVARRRAVGSLALMAIGLLVWLITCPWLWPAPVARVWAFLEFYREHQLTAVYYFGQKWNYGSQVCPWHYAWVMTAISTPPLTLLAAVIGLDIAFRRFKARPILPLVAICALLPLAFNTLPGQARYDGVRLFSASSPHFAILAGVALASLTSRRRRVTCAVILAGGFWAIGSSNPHCLSYYNVLIGGTRGAERAGMEMTYWAESLNDDVIDYLNVLPKGSRIKTRALHDRALIHEQQWGRLDADIVIGGDDPSQIDFHLIQNRRGMWGEFDWAIHDEYLANAPGRVKTWDYHGVPLLYLYDTRTQP